jgi:hypothetical protein
MAVLAISAAGAAIGWGVAGTIGVTAATGAAWGWMAGSVLGNMFFGPKTHSQGPKLTNYHITESTYGQTIPIVYGGARLGTQVIWAGEVTEIANTSRVGKRQYVTEYRYQQSCAVAICQGPVQAIRRVWFDNKLMYSADHNDIIEALAVGKFIEVATFYFGSESQSIDPTMQAEQGGAVPAYLGLCYMVFNKLDLTEWGNRIPSINVEVIEYGQYSVPSVINTYGTWGYNAGAVPGEMQITMTQWPGAAGHQTMAEHEIDTYPGGLLHAYRKDLLVDDGNTKEDNILWDIYGTNTTELKSPAASDPSGFYIEGLKNVFDTPTDTYWTYAYATVCINDPHIAYQEIAGYWEGYSKGWQISGCWILRSPACEESGLGILSLTGQAFGKFDANMVRDKEYLYAVAKHPTIVDAKQVLCFALRRSMTYYRDTRLTLEDIPVQEYDIPVGVTSSIGFGSLTGGDSWIGVDEVTGDVYFRIFDHPTHPEWLYRCIRGPVLAIKEIYTNVPFKAGGEYSINVWNNMLVVINDWGNGGNYSMAQYSIPEPGNPLVTFMGETNVTNDTINGTPWSIPIADGVFLTQAYQWTMSPRLVSAGRTLDQVITKICDPVLLPADLDVSDVSSILVRGYTIERRTTRRSAIEPLLAAYGCEAFESEGKLKVVRKGKAPVATVEYQHLGATQDSRDSQEPIFSATREQLSTIPTRVDVQYMRYDASYQQGNQIAQRGQVLTDQQVSVSFPISLTDAEAAQSAWRILTESWMQRTSREWTTSLRYAYLEPADVILLEQASGVAVRERIIEKQEDDGILRFKSVLDDDGTYVQVSSGVSGPSGGGTIIQGAPTTQLSLFEVPPLNDLDSLSAILYAAGSVPSGRDSEWNRATIYMSPVDDSTTQQIGELTTLSISGTTTTVLRSWSELSEQASDPRSWFDATVYGTPSEYSEAQQLSGSGLAVVGREVISYRNADLLASNQYRFSGIIRGLYGTSYAADEHVASEKIILIPSTAEVVAVSRNSTEINTNRKYRAVTSGGAYDDAPTVGYQFKGQTLVPINPVHVHTVRQSNGDRTIKWTRRNRAYQAWVDSTDVPNSETTETYQIELYVAGTDTLLRSAVVTTPSYTYTAANIATDFGLIPSTIRIVISQLSSIVGYGEEFDSTVIFASDWNMLYEVAPFLSGPNDAAIPTSLMTLYSAGSYTFRQYKESGRTTWSPYLNNMSGSDIKIRQEQVPTILNFEIRCRLVSTSSPASYRTGLCARTTNWWNGGVYGCGLVLQFKGDGVSNSSLQLGYGSNSNATSFTQIAINNGYAQNTYYDLIWSCIGATNRVYINGTNVANLAVTLTAPQYSATAGQVGIIAYDSSGGKYYHDLQVYY